MEQEKLRNKIKELAIEYYKFSEKNYVMKNIPASGKCIGAEELINMIDASLDMWLTSGRFEQEFLNKLKNFLNVKYVITTNSGSSSNMIALSALTSYKLGNKKINKGDEIITVANSFPTTVTPILQLGLIPVFVDCELETYNINVDKIEEAISEKTKAIFIAHTLGNPFNVDKITEICKKYNLWLIEDNCDSLGSEYKGKKTGTFGDISTMSFYPAHHITTGEGGAVATNNELLKNIIVSYRDWGRDCICPTGNDGVCQKRFEQKIGNLPFGYDHKYTYSHPGFNLKMTDLQASIGVAQIDKLNFFLKKREDNSEYLSEKLSDLDKYIILPKSQKYSKHSWFGYLITLKENSKFTKNELVKFLENRYISTRQLFSGNILRQPMITENDINFRIADSGIINSKDLSYKYYSLLPVTEYIMNNTFWVGVHPKLSCNELDLISEAIHEYFIDG